MKFNNRIHIIFIIFLLIGSAIRISYFNDLYDVTDGDTARDYMVARHVVKYHEYPLTGPNNAVYDALRASPLYYYLLSIPIAINDNVYSIGVLNVLLQAVAISSLYGLAFILFGQTTAIVTAILLLFNQELFFQSFYMIQAHFGYAFFNLSYFFLSLGYVRRSYNTVFTGTILFTLGCSVAFHGFPALFGFLLITFAILKSLRTPPSDIWRLFISMACVGVFFYTPIIIRLIEANQGLFLMKEPVYALSISTFPIKILGNIRLAIDAWMTAPWISPSVKNLLLSGLGLLLLYNTVRHKLKASIYALILSAYTLQVVILASFLRTQTHSYQYDAITGLAFVLMAFTTTSLWTKNIYNRATSIIFTLALIFLVIPNSGLGKRIQTQTTQIQIDQAHMTPLFRYIERLKKEYPTDWNIRFQIAMYDGKLNMYHWKESVIWNELEHRYNIPFVRVTNDGYNYETLNKRDERYILLCDNYTSIEDAKKRCVSSFLSNHQGLAFTTQIESDKSPEGYILLIEEIKH